MSGGEIFTMVALTTLLLLGGLAFTVWEFYRGGRAMPAPAKVRTDETEANGRG